MAQHDPPGWLPDQLRDIPFWPSRDVRLILPGLRDTLGLTEIEARVAVELERAHRMDGAIGYSRRSQWYSDHPNMPPGATWRNVVAAFDRLDHAGLIYHHRQAPGCRGWQSSAKAKEVLIDAVRPLLLEHGPLPLIRVRTPIILRDVNSANISLPRSRDLDRMARQVEAINEAIRATSVKTGDGLDIGAQMVRVFNLDLRHGGRLYGQGASWQILPSVQRAAVRINDEAVVEIDFRTLHPALLYAEVAAPLPDDAYDLGPRWPRPLAKVGMLTAINAPNVHSARGAVAHHPLMAPLAQPGSQEAHALAQRLLDALHHQHRPIAGAFFSGAGLRLMRTDSDLALSVVGMMLQRGVVVLAVHDSFIVPASKADQLEAAMQQAAHQIGLLDVRMKRVQPA